ncbi:hypothetical protein IKF81_00590 [Candidatus Saccharibacteria bacterium]|nr:hypothetical protein [Candidatus Saccharibacteria bacterium]
MKTLKEWLLDHLDKWYQHEKNFETPEEKQQREERQKEWEENLKNQREERERQEKEKEQYIQSRRDERKNKQVIPLIFDPQTIEESEVKLNIWLKPKTIDFLREQTNAKSEFSLIFLRSLYPKKASDYEQIIIPYDIALDIAEGAKDMEVAEEKEPWRYGTSRERSGIVLCRDNSSGKEYLLLSSEDASEPKIVVANTSLLVDQGTSSSSFCCHGMEYLSHYEGYKGIVLLTDAKIVERLSIF